MLFWKTSVLEERERRRRKERTDATVCGVRFAMELAFCWGMNFIGVGNGVAGCRRLQLKSREGKVCGKWEIAGWDKKGS